MKSMVIILALLLTCATAQANIQWTWTNAGTGTEQGTFTTAGDLVGDLAPAGTYTVLDFSVTASHYGLPLGSISGGVYSIGMPDIGFDWDGAGPTLFWRQSGYWTNGFGLDVVDYPPIAPNYLVFNINYFAVEDYDDEIEYIVESQTPILAVDLTAVEKSSFGRIKLLYR